MAAVASTGDARGDRESGGPARWWPSGLWAGLMLPREHGAWAMLLMAYLVGTAAAGWAGWPSLLFLLSMVAVFASSRPLDLVLQSLPQGGAGQGPGEEALQRRRQALTRLATYWGLAGAAGLGLLLSYERSALLPLAAVAGAALAAQMVLRRRRLDRTAPVRLLSIAALSVAGPAAHYAASGALDRPTAAVWLLAFLYSGSSVFYVRLHHRPSPRQKGPAGTDGRARAERQLALYLAVAALAAVGASLLGWLPPLGTVALVPLAAKAAWASRRRDYQPSVRRLGLMEIGHAALFAVLAVAVLSTWG